MAECLLRKTGIVHHDASPNMSEPIPMRKPLTGEPCAGEPHARFGGRGGRESFSTPIKNRGSADMLNSSHRIYSWLRYTVTVHLPIADDKKIQSKKSPPKWAWSLDKVR